MTREDTVGWAEELERLAARIASRFRRQEPRRRARSDRRGLLAPWRRKAGWPLAEAAGDRTPDGLSRRRWDAAAVRGHLRAHVVEHPGASDAARVLLARADLAVVRKAAVGGRDRARPDGGPEPVTAPRRRSSWYTDSANVVRAISRLRRASSARPRSARA
jgi:hypothetical protein